jgi:hypothetical protein
MAASLYWVYWTGQDEVKQPLYHAAVDAVTGLDLETDLGRPTLNPEFNLASRSVTTGWCFYGGSTVKVSYLDVELASGALPRLCVGPRRSGEQGSVVAWGNAVAGPRKVRDALANDLRRGAAEFDVELTVAESPHAISWVVLSCRTKVGSIGGAADRRRRACELRPFSPGGVRVKLLQYVSETVIWKTIILELLFVFPKLKHDSLICPTACHLHKPDDVRLRHRGSRAAEVAYTNHPSRQYAY